MTLWEGILLDKLLWVLNPICVLTTSRIELDSSSRVSDETRKFPKTLPQSLPGYVFPGLCHLNHVPRGSPFLGEIRSMMQSLDMNPLFV